MTQANLFDNIHETAFEAYHRDNPPVYEAFVRFTMQAIRAGRKHVGSKDVVEKIRFESAVSEKNSEFKINNNFTPFLARKFMKDYPRYAGIFQLRASKADEVGV